MKSLEEREEYLKEVKRTVIACDGSVSVAAVALGIRRTRLSQLLNHNGLVHWWVPYKAKRKKENERARNRRYQQRRRERLRQQANEVSDEFDGWIT
jgi:hypothetical protein